MKNIYCLLFALFISLGGLHASSPPKGKLKKITPPPGTITIAENFYADECEITNIDYLEYLFWTKRVYGETSPTYRAALLDTLVWQHELSYSEPYTTYYHSHPAYIDYPVVGISYEQAKNYAKWRSDRVFEMMLIQKNLIKARYEGIDENNHFTIERYFAGEYFDEKPQYDVPYPEYRLPTEAEWEQLATAGVDTVQYQWGIDYRQYPHRRWDDHLANLKYPPVVAHNQKGDEFLLNFNADLTAPKRSYFPNEFGLYNMIGNVAEMVEEQGVAKGGSFTHKAADVGIKTKFAYHEPQSWLGVRYVCRWVMPKG